jgi:hypothetical protein
MRVGMRALREDVTDAVMKELQDAKIIEVAAERGDLREIETFQPGRVERPEELIEQVAQQHLVRWS